MRLLVTSIASPLGQLRIAVAEGAVRLLEFDGLERADRQLQRVCRRLGAEAVAGTSPTTDRLSEELARYFAGERLEFTTPIALAGTSFQQSVWQQLGAIPIGQTRSYAAIARSIGNPAAVRAVGAANGANPVSILVPCHRVVNSGGALGGYGGGLERKRWLLEHERRFSRETLFA